MQLYLAALGAIKTKLYSLIPPKKSRKTPENICDIKFSDKAVRLINPSAIFNNRNTRSVCTVVYNLRKPICSKMFNFNTFVFSINLDAILENPESIPCICKRS